MSEHVIILTLKARVVEINAFNSYTKIPYLFILSLAWGVNPFIYFLHVFRFCR